MRRAVVLVMFTAFPAKAHAAMGPGMARMVSDWRVVPALSRAAMSWALTGQFRGGIELKLGLSASKRAPLMERKRGDSSTRTHGYGARKDTSP